MYFEKKYSWFFHLTDHLVTSFISLILLVVVERFDHYRNSNGNVIVKWIHRQRFTTP
jgi:hypothetical protein